MVLYRCRTACAAVLRCAAMQCDAKLLSLNGCGTADLTTSLLAPISLSALSHYWILRALSAQL